MNKDDNQNDFEKAIEALRSETEESISSSPDFEHRVWSEIAIRESRAGEGLSRWLSGGRFFVAAPLAASIAILAIGGGVFLGLSQAEAYGRQAALSMEQRYVESIHPVMKSDHAGHDH